MPTPSEGEPAIRYLRRGWEVAESMLQPFPVNEYPNLVEILSAHVMKPGYDHGDEFEYGLDVILDGLQRVLDVADEVDAL
jgi:hypothetical protein